MIKEIEDYIQKDLVIVSGTSNTFITGQYTGYSTTYAYYNPQ